MDDNYYTLTDAEEFYKSEGARVQEETKHILCETAGKTFNVEFS